MFEVVSTPFADTVKSLPSQPTNSRMDNSLDDYDSSSDWISTLGQIIFVIALLALFIGGAKWLIKYLKAKQEQREEEELVVKLRLIQNN